MTRCDKLFIPILVAMLLAVTAASGQDVSPAPKLLAAGEGGTLWLVRQTGVDAFQLYHRNADGEPGAIHPALKSKGTPIAAVAGGRLLYLVYSDNTVQSLRFVLDPTTQLPGYDVRQLAPLPSGAALVDLAVDDGQLLALIRPAPSAPPASEAPATAADDAPTPADQADATDEPQDEPAPASPAPPAPSAEPEAAPELPPFRLLRLTSGSWQALPLPDGLHAARPPRLAVVGSSHTVQLIDRSENGAVLTVRARDGQAWQSTIQTLKTTERFDVLTPMGLCVVVDRVDDKQLLCTILRNGSLLEAGRIPVPSGKAGYLSLCTFRDEPAVAVWVSDERVRVAHRDLTARPDADAGVTDLAVRPWPSAPINRELMLFALMVVMGVFVLATWRRDPKAALVALPEGMVPAEFTRRFFAGMIDMGPPIFIAMLLEGVADPAAVLANWPQPTGDWSQMMPGVLAIALFVLHTGITEALAGTSLGKRVLGLWVVNTKGGPPNVWQVIVRNLIKIVELLVWFLLLFMFFNPARQRMGDLAARTVVIRRVSTDESSDEGEASD